MAAISPGEDEWTYTAYAIFPFYTSNSMAGAPFTNMN